MSQTTVPGLHVENEKPYWVIRHLATGQIVKTGESFRYGNGTSFGFFNTKRDAIKAADSLRDLIDWTNTNTEYYTQVGLRDKIRECFGRIGA